MRDIVDDIVLLVGFAAVVLAVVMLAIWIVQPPEDICDRRVQNLTVQQIADCTAKLEKETLE